MSQLDPCEKIMQFFTWSHLPVELQATSKRCCDLAKDMVHLLPHNPELTVGLRKLLEAKDAFVRARLYKEESIGE